MVKDLIKQNGEVASRAGLRIRVQLARIQIRPPRKKKNGSGSGSERQEKPDSDLTLEKHRICNPASGALQDLLRIRYSLVIIYCYYVIMLVIQGQTVQWS